MDSRAYEDTWSDDDKSNEKEKTGALAPPEQRNNPETTNDELERDNMEGDVDASTAGNATYC